VTGVGIDVGASRVHLVALAPGADGRQRVVATDVLPADDASRVVGWLASLADRMGPIRRVAIDAPSDLSTRPHGEDASLAPKFRAARCGEIALGRDVGVWVPWVSPPVGAQEIAPWISVGLTLFATLADAGVDAVETFPHAVFRVLNNGGRVAAKSKAEGVAERAALLRAAGVDEPTLTVWGHDGLDAAAAALVAVDPDACAITCGHDASAIWIPARPVLSGPSGR